MAKKKNASSMFREAPVTSYPFAKNRMLIIDWASLSYHQFFSIASDKNREKYGLLDADGELALWRNKVLGKVLQYVILFNPNHIIFALEGKAAWRRDFVREYYEQHTEIYWNRNAYYVVSDNYAYEVMKADDGTGYSVTRVPMKSYSVFTKLEHHKKLGEFDAEHQKEFWNIYTSKGVPIIPSYKGTRKNKVWKFSVDRHMWMDYKDSFAMELAPLFRARAVKCPVAEGDDIIYSSVMKYAGDSDDVIIVTGDSDMSQIDVKNVRIFNHRTDTFVVEPNPGKYLDAKVLTGDSTDNINGMAFVDKDTGHYRADKKDQISDAGAAALMTACPNIYQTAKDNGWDDQYMRNRKLIDLSMVPGDIKKTIMEAVSVGEPELIKYPDFDAWDITEKYRRMIQSMQGVGFYCMQTEDAIRENPGIFNRALLEQAAAKVADARAHVSPDWSGSFGDDIDELDVVF